MIYLLIFIFTFHLRSISANTCEKYQISHLVQNDSVVINFTSNEILKLDRYVQCNSSVVLSPINGCIHRCTGLGYGQLGEISLRMTYTNGTSETCSIDYATPLQAPSLADLKIVNNKVRLSIYRPMDSFDYVEVDCSNQESRIIFNSSIPSDNSKVTVDCSFLPNSPLMNFVIKTIKKDFDPAFISITREVPLPISYAHYIAIRLLIILATPPPTMNTKSTCEFQLLAHDPNNEQIIYERIKLINLDPAMMGDYRYGLVPNLNHTFIFKHMIPNIGYSQSDTLILPIFNPSYPFAVTNLRIKEEFNMIILHWNDSHEDYDPIEYFVSCGNPPINVERNTTYICEQMTLQETTFISVETRVIIPGYTYDRTAIARIDVSQIPDIPALQIVNTTERSITIRWDQIDESVELNAIRFQLKCYSDDAPIDIDIRSNTYQCQSLVPGTLYIITMILETMDQTIQRAKSIQANTLLEKCQYRNHFYPPNLDDMPSVIIEWSPPSLNFDQITVYCPSSYTTYELPQIMPVMFIKCLVMNGIQFTVTLMTIKSGYERVILQVIDMPPNVSRTTTTTTSTIIPLSCPPNTSIRVQTALTQWRIAAIVAFIVGGFLLLALISLIVLSVIFYSRNRDKTNV